MGNVRGVLAMVVMAGFSACVPQGNPDPGDPTKGETGWPAALILSFTWSYHRVGNEETTWTATASGSAALTFHDRTQASYQGSWYDNEPDAGIGPAMVMGHKKLVTMEATNETCDLDIERLGGTDLGIEIGAGGVGYQAAAYANVIGYGDMTCVQSPGGHTNVIQDTGANVNIHAPALTTDCATSPSSLELNGDLTNFNLKQQLDCGDTQVDVTVTGRQ